MLSVTKKNDSNGSEKIRYILLVLRSRNGRRRRKRWRRKWEEDEEVIEEVIEDEKEIYKKKENNSRGEKW